MSLDFDGQVALITGAGGGLGRAYALELARRGARVAVVDPGGGRDGAGASDAATAVADEIIASGGAAIAAGISVTDARAMADFVGDVSGRWGRIDILINNAGILRDRSFAKLSLEEWHAVVDVHLTGAVIATRAVWPIMRAQVRGRIVLTTSSAGLYGNFGQANYAAAKLGLVGLMQTLAIEGERCGIHVNALAPLAATRMSEDVFGPEALARFRPEAIIPAMLHLVSGAAPTGTVLVAGGGRFHVADITMSQGVVLPPQQWTPEDIAAAWAAITDRADDCTPDSAPDHFAAIMQSLSTSP